ncbi:MAG: hypothetical protein O7A68_00360 [Alphaproteobacteria bacterium]|nr:hypothetical protein [Alphaproteobacteria bacterium]
MAIAPGLRTGIWRAPSRAIAAPSSSALRSTLTGEVRARIAGRIADWDGPG